METLPLMDVAGLAGRVEYNRLGSSSLFDTAIHQVSLFPGTENLSSRGPLTTAQGLSQMESLRVGTDGLVSLLETGDSSSFDLSNGRARVMYVDVPL